MPTLTREVVGPVDNVESVCQACKHLECNLEGNSEQSFLLTFSTERPFLLKRVWSLAEETLT